MRIIAFFILGYFSLHAEIYYAKVEPIASYVMKASYGGEVLESLKKFESTKSQGQRVLWLDDSLDKKELNASQEKLKSLRKNVTLIKQNSLNAKETARLREENYARMKDLKTKSKVEKENELITFLNAQTQYLSLEQSLETVMMQIRDLEYHSDFLKDKIAKKNIHVEKGFLIYKIYPTKGDYVSVGAPLVEVYDTRQGKLTLFLSLEDKQKADKRVIYIDGERSHAVIDKIWDVADTYNISTYRCEILLPEPTSFSVLKKIEFKEH